MTLVACAIIALVSGVIVALFWLAVKFDWLDWVSADGLIAALVAIGIAAHVVGAVSGAAAVVWWTVDVTASVFGQQDAPECFPCMNCGCQTQYRCRICGRPCCNDCGSGENGVCPGCVFGPEFDASR